MNKIAIFALQSLIAANCASLAAHASRASDDSLRRMALSTWTTEQGLPQNFVRTIAQTHDGFIWVGTMNGLARFDGVRFRTFARQGVPELGQSIAGLAPDTSGGLWIATATQLIHFANGQFKPVPLSGDLHYRIEIFASARVGGAWIYGAGKLMRTNGDRLEPRSLPRDARPLRDLAESVDGTLWAADGESVFAMRSGEGPVRYALAGARMICADNFGAVFAGDGHRLFRFDAGSFHKVEKPGLDNFVSVLVDHQHRLWMASGGLHGLSRNANGVRETLTAAEGLAANDVRTIFEDRGGDVWIGTISGLQRLHSGLFTTYTSQDGLMGGERKGDQIEAVFAAKTGDVWAGSLEGGVAEFAAGKWKRLGAKQGLSAGQVRGFAEDDGAPVVAISDYGIFHRRGERFAKIAGIPKGYVGTPVRTSDGSLWFSVDHRGLFRMQHGLSAHVGLADGVPDGTIWSIAGNESGALWVGVGSELLRWNSSKFEHVRTLPSPAVSICALRNKGIVVGMLNGLLLNDSTGRDRVLTQQYGLPGDTVLDAIADEDSNLWIATPRAIARIQRSDWNDFVQHRIDHLNPQVFTREDGLRSNAVLPLNEVTAARAPDGRIWFATPLGVSVVDPKIAPDKQEAAIVDSVTVDDHEEPAGNLTIGPGQHRVTFAYTAPPTSSAEQTRFRYRLFGWDRNWIEAGAAREVSYTALQPGSYHFEVLAINRFGSVSPAVALVSLEMRPYFWQTKVFLAFSILAIALVIVEVTRRRTRAGAERLSLRFQERVAERERIAYQIHDTVIQDMIGAALQVELLGFQIADQPEKAEDLLGTLARRLRETIARSRNMVSNLHSTAVTQYSLVEVLRHAEAEFRLGDLPDFELVSEGEPRHIHPLVRDEVYRICREALANAFRHANAEHVRVKVSFLADSLEVEIADDGQGMDEETRLNGRPGHFGLPGIAAHAERIGALVDIVSSPGAGTKVLLRVQARERRWFALRSWLPRKASQKVLVEQNEVELHDTGN